MAKASPRAKLSALEIAAQLLATKNKNTPMMLDRILRLLSSHNVIECSLDDVDGSKRDYGLNDVSKYIMHNQDGVSLGPLMSLNQDKGSLDSWFVCSFSFFNNTLVNDASVFLNIQIQSCKFLNLTPAHT